MNDGNQFTADEVKDLLDISQLKPVIDYICLWLALIKQKSILQFDQLYNLDQVYSSKNGLEGNILFPPSLFCRIGAIPVLENKFYHLSTVNNIQFGKNNLRFFKDTTDYHRNYIVILNFIKDYQLRNDLNKVVNELLSFESDKGKTNDVFFLINDTNHSQSDSYYKIDSFNGRLRKMSLYSEDITFSLHVDYKRVRTELDRLRLGSLDDYIDKHLVET